MESLPEGETYKFFPEDDVCWGTEVDVIVGVGVGVKVGVAVTLEVDEETVKLIESRYNVPSLKVRLWIAMTVIRVAFAPRSDKGIVYTFQVPDTRLPP